jgi:RNA 3'-terminal phosphate cyclase (ATP)
VDIKVTVCGSVPVSIAQRVVTYAMVLLNRYFKEESVEIRSEIVHDKQSANGFSVIVIARTSGGGILAGSALGSKEALAEGLAREACKQLLYNLRTGGCVDEHLQDQIIIFCALAKGTSRFRCGAPTLHTETAMYFVGKVTGAKFRIFANTEGNRKNELQSFIIECDGIGATFS